MLIEDILTIQMDKLEKPPLAEEDAKELLSRHQAVVYGQSSSEYALEKYINERLGKGIKDLYSLVEKDVIYCGR